MSHSPVLYTVSFPDAASIAAAHGRFNDGDFGYVKTTGSYYTYYEIPPFVPPPGTIYSIEGGAWVVFSGGGPSPPSTTEYVEATFPCDVSVQVRDAVYVDGLSVVQRANAAQTMISAAMAAVGVVSAKPTPTTATVRYTGALGGFSGLNPGQVYYLGPSLGAITDTPADAPGYLVQRLGTAFDANTLIIEANPNTVLL